MPCCFFFLFLFSTISWQPLEYNLALLPFSIFRSSYPSGHPLRLSFFLYLWFSSDFHLFLFTFSSFLFFFLLSFSYFSLLLSILSNLIFLSVQTHCLPMCPIINSTPLSTRYAQGNIVQIYNGDCIHSPTKLSYSCPPLVFIFQSACMVVVVDFLLSCLFLFFFFTFSLSLPFSFSFFFLFLLISPIPHGSPRTFHH